MDTDVELTLDAAAPRKRRWPPRRRTWILGAALLALGAMAAIVLAPEGDPEADEVAVLAGDDEVTTTTSTQPSTTTGVEVVVTDTTVTSVVIAETTAPPTTSRPRRTTTTAAPTTTTTTLPAHCRNSTDPVCGPFYWDPEPPPNQPLVISFVDLPTRWNILDGGMPVRFQWSDADGFLTYGVVTIDGTDPRRGACGDESRFGPWTPPEPHPGSGTHQAEYVYFPSPGTYELALGVGTHGCGWPQRSDAVLRATIEVVYEQTPDAEPPPEEPPPDA